MTHTDSTKRHDFILLFDVTNGNPNGDPDAGNLPRMDPETMCGLVTDVALKRKVRDYVSALREQPIFIQSQTALNTLYYRAARDAGAAAVELSPEKDPELKDLLGKDEGELQDWLENLEAEGLEFDSEKQAITYLGEARKNKDFSDLLKGDREVAKSLDPKLKRLAAKLAESAGNKPKPNAKTREETRNVLFQKYYDIRMFGAVLTGGTNAGQVRGPLQLTFARSVSPVAALDLSITRVAITREADRRRKETEMGRKAIVPYGLYRAHGFFNPHFAKQTRVTDGDLSLFWEAI
jgi:CRISPR-associated protein Csd2